MCGMSCGRSCTALGIRRATSFLSFVTRLLFRSSLYLRVQGKMEKASVAEKMDDTHSPSPPVDEKDVGYTAKIENPLDALPDPDAGLSDEERALVVGELASPPRELGRL